MSIKGIEQGRASFAFEEVKEFVKPNEDTESLEKEKLANKIKKNKTYKSYVKKIPMLIKTNGLGATLAFMYSKKEKANLEGDTYNKILETIKLWITSEDEKKLMTLDSDKDFIEELLKVDNSTYKAITFEVLELFSWIRRFAEGMVEDDDKQGSGEHEPK